MAHSEPDSVAVVHLKASKSSRRQAGAARDPAAVIGLSRPPRAPT